MSLKVVYINPWSGLGTSEARDIFISRVLRDIDPKCEIFVHNGAEDITRYDLAISLYHPRMDVRSVNARKVICFTGESYDVVSTTPGCDAYIGFDLEDEHVGKGYKYLRFPLYAGYHIDYCDRHAVSSLDALKQRYAKDKKPRMSAVVSNPSNQIRNQVLQWFMENGSSTGHPKGMCDSGGRLFNNVGEVTDKLDFTSKYAVGMAFENLPKRSYITEKIYEVYAADSVPFYFGAPDIGLEFNPKTFLSLDISGDPMSSIERVISVMRDPIAQSYMKSIDPCEGFRSEKYIRNGRGILRDFIMELLETK